MSIRFFIRRCLFLLLVVWAAFTLVFFIPRLSSRNPIRERFAALARSGGFSPTDMEKIVASYNAKFGLDASLPEQYALYMGSILTGDLGYSFNQYPKRVIDLILEALPYSVPLYGFAIAASFFLGNLLGALSAWPKTPRWLKSLAVPLTILQGVHPVVLGIVLVNIIAFQMKLLPIAGTYSPGLFPAFTAKFLLDVLAHLTLPALSLILASAGGWALSMRGMGVTIQGEDYVNFAEHKGLKAGTIFGNYYVRNAMIPSVTALALNIGAIVTSGLLVENLYAIQGLGTVLNQAIQVNDFPVIYGIVIFIIAGVSVAMLLTDLLIPLLDPRIRMNRT